MTREMRALERAIKFHGTQEKLARAIGKRQTNITSWLRRDGRAPATACRAIQKSTNGEVTVFQLRPDVFGRNVKELQTGIQ